MAPFIIGGQKTFIIFVPWQRLSRFVSSNLKMKKNFSPCSLLDMSSHLDSRGCGGPTDRWCVDIFLFFSNQEGHSERIYRGGCKRDKCYISSAERKHMTNVTVLAYLSYICLTSCLLFMFSCLLFIVMYILVPSASFIFSCLLRNLSK